MIEVYCDEQDAEEGSYYPGVVNNILDLETKKITIEWRNTETYTYDDTDRFEELTLDNETWRTTLNSVVVATGTP